MSQTSKFIRSWLVPGLSPPSGWDRTRLGARRLLLPLLRKQPMRAKCEPQPPGFPSTGQPVNGPSCWELALPMSLESGCQLLCPSSVAGPTLVLMKARDTVMNRCSWALKPSKSLSYKGLNSPYSRK